MGVGEMGKGSMRMGVGEMRKGSMEMGVGVGEMGKGSMRIEEWGKGKSNCILHILLCAAFSAISSLKNHKSRCIDVIQIQDRYIFIYTTHPPIPQVHTPLGSSYLGLDVFLEYEPSPDTPKFQPG